jgi:hypothetical protein
MAVTILLGVLMGLLVGAAVCARYLRQEIAADTGPRPRRTGLRFDTLTPGLNLATGARLASLNEGVLHV